MDFDWHDAQEENVLVAADLALNRGIAELGLVVGCDFVMLCLHEVHDDVRGQLGFALGVAEPLVAVLLRALHHAPLILQAAVAL